MRKVRGFAVFNILTGTKVRGFCKIFLLFLYKYIILLSVEVGAFILTAKIANFNTPRKFVQLQ